jgi:hypothetical protein
VVANYAIDGGDVCGCPIEQMKLGEWDPPEISMFGQARFAIDDRRVIRSESDNAELVLVGRRVYESTSRDPAK